MELRDALLRIAAARPGVLLAVCPGATRARLAVEDELRRRGWPLVLGPAQADLLVVVGESGSSGPEDWAEALWNAMPVPRARVVVRHAAEAAAVLDRGSAALLAPEARIPAPANGPAGGEHDHSGHDHGGHAGHDMSVDAHEGHDEHAGHEGHTDGDAHGDAPDPDSGHDMSHGEHAGHDAHAGRAVAVDGGHEGHDMHGGHDMGGHGHHMHHGGDVNGFPMASQAEDRDGLKLDRLHVPLGPALADWPTGLLLRLTLQGDVVREAAVEPLAPAHHAAAAPYPYWSEPWLRAAAGERVERGEAARRLCAAHLDSLGRFFAVAGWDDLVVRARRARRQALAGAEAGELLTAVRPLIRRAERSRTLRRLMAGIGPLGADQARAAGVTGPALAAGGDAYDRMRCWLDEVGLAAAGCGDTGTLDPEEGDGPRGTVAGAIPASAALLGVLPHMLQGAEFACARVIVASLDPDLDELAYTQSNLAGMNHG